LGRTYAAESFTVTGDLTISGLQVFTPGGDLNIKGHSVVVTGNLGLTYPYFGTLTMRDPAGLLTVVGDVSFDGNTNEGLLTAGEMRVAHNFFVGGAAERHFAATETFRVVFNGTTPQFVNFCCGAGAASNRFQDVVLANAAGVTLQTDIFIAGRLTT